jgi:MinD superfamily P-loop ATPase
MRIAFASGKGGTGKTTFATNMAASIASQHRQVVYADCDVEEPNGHIFLHPDKIEEIDVGVMVPAIDKDKCNLCGVCVDVCEFNALAILGPEPLVFPSLCHSCRACVELCPEQAIRDSSRITGKIEKGTFGALNFLSGNLNTGEAMAPPVTRALKELIPDAEVVIIDCPPGTSCPVIEAVKGSDFVVLVTEPTPFGLNDLKLAYEMLLKLGIPFGVVINQSDLGDGRVEEFCRENDIEILLRVPFNRGIAEAYSNGLLATEINSKFDDSMRQLYNHLKEKTNHG